MHSKPTQAMRAYANKARPGTNCTKVTSSQFFNNIISPDTSVSAALTSIFESNADPKHNPSRPLDLD
jgi:hypothetical protein